MFSESSPNVAETVVFAHDADAHRQRARVQLNGEGAGVRPREAGNAPAAANDGLDGGGGNQTAIEEDAQGLTDVAPRDLLEHARPFAVEIERHHGQARRGVGDHARGGAEELTGEVLRHAPVACSERRLVLRALRVEAFAVVELSRAPDEALRLVDVGDPSELHDDLVAAAALDQGLGHAEGVDAAAHHVHHALDLLVGDAGVVGAVDEQRAALQVEPEPQAERAVVRAALEAADG